VDRWQGKRVVILGAARQGTALARYLAHHGANVILTDTRPAADLQDALAALHDLPVEWVLGEHPLALLQGADLVCPSGGVPLDIPFLLEARRRGIRLSNDTEIFLQQVPGRVIGITGSAGKTTTTTLVGRMAQAAGELPGGRSPYRRVWVGGNIGNPLISELEHIQPEDLVVLELSSFQLELVEHSPHIAAVLNITPNHLDRHGTMQAYRAAKSRILAYQSPEDWAVLGRDDPGAWDLRRIVRGRSLSFGLSPLPVNANGTILAGDWIILQRDQMSQELLKVEEIELRGQHNLLNVIAACTLAAAADLPVESIQAGVRGFKGVAHRLEFVRAWGGARWYNDSIATAPERAIAAMLAFDEPLVLLAGGRDKQLPWEEFARVVSQRVDHLIVFGEAADLILSVIDRSLPRPFTLDRCQSLSEAVQAAARRVSPGDVVLLSPGGTSFDEFHDFEERGERYREWVNNLS
jgi:UDP-N-acetylmuramoylalanine--D-glutamate ligase